MVIMGIASGGTPDAAQREGVHAMRSYILWGMIARRKYESGQARDLPLRLHDDITSF
jgi:hypothetical protein